jgi:hypothetical protein
MARPQKGKEHPQQKTADAVAVLAGNGFAHADIAKLLKVSTETLHDHYKEQLDDGSLLMKHVAVSKYAEAIKSGESWAVKLFLSHRMGISDKLQLEGGDPDKPIKHVVERRIVRPEATDEPAKP